MRRWTDACVANSGLQNVYKSDGRTYFWELSRKEHEDGAITGSIVELLGTPAADGAQQGRKAGSFRIEGDGSVTRAPSFLKSL